MKKIKSSFNSFTYCNNDIFPFLNEGSLRSDSRNACCHNYKKSFLLLPETAVNCFHHFTLFCNGIYSLVWFIS